MAWVDTIIFISSTPWCTQHLSARLLTWMWHCCSINIICACTSTSGQVAVITLSHCAITCVCCRDKLHEPVQQSIWSGCHWVSIRPARSDVLLNLHKWPTGTADALLDRCWTCPTSNLSKYKCSLVWSAPVLHDFNLIQQTLAISMLVSIKQQIAWYNKVSCI